ncbi:MAG: terminase small subunit [Clostridium sp.]|nr:terminase small subunit [Clostridium sp.]MCM1547762.1 terminase small subunit [Ruminococcus sp.]
MPETNHRSLCRLFCCNYARLGNIFEAALKSGFPPETALADGIEIMNQAKYRKLIESFMQKNVTPESAVMTGLERLAFGRANDAALLVFSDEMPTSEQIDSLDLFNVSEMKKVKGGGVEIKLFDRQKALERIYEYSFDKSASAAAENLIEALTSHGDESDEI